VLSVKTDLPVSAEHLDMCILQSAVEVEMGGYHRGIWSEGLGQGLGVVGKMWHLGGGMGLSPAFPSSPLHAMPPALPPVLARARPAAVWPHGGGVCIRHSG
jgi:hypothetical protein